MPTADTIPKARSPALLVYLNCKNACTKTFKPNNQIKSLIIVNFILDYQIRINKFFNGLFEFIFEVNKYIIKERIMKKNRKKMYVVPFIENDS